MPIDPTKPNPSMETRPEKVISFGFEKRSFFMAHKFLSFLLLLLVSAAVVSGIYYWETVRELPSFIDVPKHKLITATWRTYENDKYRFQIKYPNDWKLSTVKGIVYFVGPNSTCGADPSLATKSCKYLAFIGESPAPATALLSTKLGENDWRYKLQESGDIVVDDYFVVSPDDKSLLFKYAQRHTNLPNNPAEVEQILSTFKFTQAAPVIIAPTDFLTYTDSDIGFQIDYPDHLQYRYKSDLDSDIVSEEFYDPISGKIEMVIYINPFDLKLAACRPVTSIRSINGVVMNKEMYCDGMIAYRFTANSFDLVVVNNSVYTDKEFENIMKTFELTK